MFVSLSPSLILNRCLVLSFESHFIYTDNIGIEITWHTEILCVYVSPLLKCLIYYSLLASYKDFIRVRCVHFLICGTHIMLYSQIEVYKLTPQFERKKNKLQVYKFEASIALESF